MSLIEKNCQNILKIKNVLPLINEIHISNNYTNQFNGLHTYSIISEKLDCRNKDLKISSIYNAKTINFLNEQFKYQQQRLYTTHSGKYCWKCKNENKKEALFCENEKCKVIQILDPEVDYFQILGVKKEFDVNLKTLKVNFLKLQQIVHPDNFSTKSDKEKQYSDIQSSYINKAYHILINPLERALYLLDKSGHSVNEKDNVKDTQFLMTIMDINESIDDAEDQEDIDDIKNDNQERIKASIKIISESFKSGNWDTMKNETIKLRYWTNIQNTLKEWNPKK